MAKRVKTSTAGTAGKRAAHLPSAARTRRASSLEWSPGVTYLAGDVVTYAREIYRCRRKHMSLRGKAPPTQPGTWLWMIVKAAPTRSPKKVAKKAAKKTTAKKSTTKKITKKVAKKSSKSSQKKKITKQPSKSSRQKKQKTSALPSPKRPTTKNALRDLLRAKAGSKRARPKKVTKGSNRSRGSKPTKAKRSARTLQKTRAQAAKRGWETRRSRTHVTTRQEHDLRRRLREFISTIPMPNKDHPGSLSELRQRTYTDWYDAKTKIRDRLSPDAWTQLMIRIGLAEGLPTSGNWSLWRFRDS